MGLKFGEHQEKHQEKQLSSKKEDCTQTFKRMTRLNMSGYPDKIIDNNLLEVKNDHKRTSLCLASTLKIS